MCFVSTTCSQCCIMLRLCIPVVLHVVQRPVQLRCGSSTSVALGCGIDPVVSRFDPVVSRFDPVGCRIDPVGINPVGINPVGSRIDPVVLPNRLKLLQPSLQTARVR